MAALATVETPQPGAFPLALYDAMCAAIDAAHRPLE